MKLHLPDDVLPTDMSEEELRLELAIALYAIRKISFGKARKLADKDWFSCRQILDERGIPAHYDEEDFEQDLRTISHLSES